IAINPPVAFRYAKSVGLPDCIDFGTLSLSALLPDCLRLEGSITATDSRLATGGVVSTFPDRISTC
uniref:hypothetical protein n=1 Tax=Clostridium symbiosum TaxID=1512 RepID=UPI003BABE149